MEKLLTTPTLSAIEKVHKAIEPYIHRTPVLTSKSIDTLCGASLFFKCENFQKTGAFKMRGATSAILGLSEEDKSKGIITHSSGNHGQAVAYAAQLFGIKATIVMPHNSPSIKIAAVKGYGAHILLCENTHDARIAMVEKEQLKSGATLVHPYDNFNVIAGQATAAKELLEDVEDLDIIITPVSGGGLLSGTALSTHFLFPATKVWAGEPEGADDAYRSFTSGTLQGNETVDTIADGLRAPLCENTFVIIQQHVSKIIKVSDEEIIRSMRLVWERMKIIIEPSCAVPLAAVLKTKEECYKKRIGLILSGGNVDLGKLPF